MKIAIEGCAHGDLEKIYDTLQYIEKEEGFKVDLLICCGDFQATRNTQDLSCMAVSKKYRNMCSFYKYYSGEKEAPTLTLFIGGNHEASNHLQELPYGGWVAPNIYYLGYAGVVTIGGVRIAGLSGIYKSRDYMRGHYEIPPYREDSMRSVYHVRNLEVFRLKQLSQPIDIMLSHDWPQGVTEYGNVELLLKRKPFFQKDIEENVLGSKPAEELLHDLKPSYWFAAHLHCKFSAIIPHGPRKEPTKFLALDKCLPRRKFLQIMELDHDESQPLELSYDLEWLSILHLTNHLLSVKRGLTYMPGPSEKERWSFTPTEEEKNHVLKRFNGDLKIPKNFKRTVEAWSPNGEEQSQPFEQLNPQTVLFCELLGVDDPLALLLAGVSQDTTLGSFSPSSFLSPDRSRDTSQVSFTDESSPSDSLDESFRNSRNTSLSSPLLRMSLPPPKLILPEEDSSEENLSLTQESSNNNSSLQADNDIDDLSNSRLDQSTSENHMSESIESQTTDETELGESSTSVSSQAENSEPQRPSKKFKRRNEALYTSKDDD